MSVPRRHLLHALALLEELGADAVNTPEHDLLTCPGQRTGVEAPEQAWSGAQRCLRIQGIEAGTQGREGPWRTARGNITLERRNQEEDDVRSD